MDADYSCAQLDHKEPFKMSLQLFSVCCSIISPLHSCTVMCTSNVCFLHAYNNDVGVIHELHSSPGQLNDDGDVVGVASMEKDGDDSIIIPRQSVTYKSWTVSTLFAKTSGNL